MEKCLKWNMELYFEKYTYEKYILVLKEKNKRAIINDVAFEIIKKFNGVKNYDAGIDKLAKMYNDNKKHVKENVDEFLKCFKLEYGIELIEVNANEVLPIEIVGEISYYPKAASIEITERCNLKCLHCYGSYGECLAGEMKLSDVKKILKDLDDIGVTTIELTGGDISTYNYLLEVLQYAISLKFQKINVLSNGLILKEEIMTYIISHKDRISGQIDLHSLSDNYLYWFTGVKNTATKLQNVIEYLLNNGVELRLATIFTKKNLKEFLNIGEWVFNHKAKWGIGLVENLGRAVSGDDSLYLSEQEIIQFQDMLNTANEMYPNMISFIDYVPNDNNCGAITTHVVIDVKGSIKLCTMDNGTYFKNEMGNCLKRPIREIFDDNVKFVYALTKYELPNTCNEECMKCSKFYGCSRCMLRNFINMKENDLKCKWYIYNVPDEVKKKFFEV